MAEQLKKFIIQASALVAHLQLLESAKVNAVQMESFDEANSLKSQIEKVKRKIRVIEENQ